MVYDDLDETWAKLIAPGAPFEIAEVEVGGQRLRGFKNALPNIRALWLSTAVFADRDYLVYGDERITYGQAHAQVAAIANWLFAEGLQPGDRVAIAMRNYPEWLLIYWACVSTGLAVVGANAWWTPEEIGYALQDSVPKVLFCDAERLERIAGQPQRAALVKLVAVRTNGDAVGATPFAQVLATAGTLPDVEIEADAEACIFYTSGTTGRSKGAQLTHRGCIANFCNMRFWSRAQELMAQRRAGVMPGAAITSPPAVVLLTIPFFHVTATNCIAYAVTAAGGALVLMYRWDAAEALKLIEREQVREMTGVPATARELIAYPDVRSYDTSSLLSLGAGGAAMHPDLQHKILATVPTARPRTGYGLTETSGIVTSISSDFLADKPTSVGRVMPGFEFKCVDDEGRMVACGELGELWVRGTPVIKGFINRPEATAEMITDGWLHTGDVARIDQEGFVHLVDRKKDMILRGGENIYCAEVEACIHLHPAVLECCVFGVPDVRLGEEVAAAIVLRPDAAASADDLRAHCAGHIAQFKIPGHISFSTSALPRNANGKYLKRQLRDQLTLDAQAWQTGVGSCGLRPDGF